VPPFRVDWNLLNSRTRPRDLSPVDIIIGMTQFTHIQPSPFRISTITAIGGVNTPINLPSLFNHLHVVKAEEITGTITSGFTHIVYACGQEEQSSRGDAACVKKKNNKRGHRRTFDNQATVIFTARRNHDDDASFALNVKVFKNGNVQITGIKEPTQGTLAVDALIHELKRIYDECDPTIVRDASVLKNVNYQICLVNTDFNLGVEIRRNVLHELMLSNHMRSTFEPCIYHDCASARARGACQCSLPCIGKGKGGEDGQCRKVTIAVFQSGCVIITGAHTVEQVQCAYDYITSFVDAHMEHIRKPQSKA
jgi:hypothetical protein